MIILIDLGGAPMRTSAYDALILRMTATPLDGAPVRMNTSSLSELFRLMNRKKLNDYVKHYVKAGATSACAQKAAKADQRRANKKQKS